MSCSADAGSGVEDGLTELTFDRHGAWSWQPPSGYAFARTWRTVPISLVELLPAAACFPIVFSPVGLPHALLRLSQEGPSPFVGEGGEWQASWLPERVRSYPFGLMDCEALCPKMAVHEGSDLVSRNGNRQPIFMKGVAGQFAGGFRSLASALHRQAGSLLQAHQAASALMELGLLKSLAQLEGFRIVDHSRIKDLSAADVQQLWSANGFGLLYAGAMSLTHLAWMEKAEQLLTHSALRMVRSKTQKSTRASGFLDALSSAPDLDQPIINLRENKS